MKYRRPLPVNNPPDGTVASVSPKAPDVSTTLITSVPEFADTDRNWAVIA
jgi:hypothetical protein